MELKTFSGRRASQNTYELTKLVEFLKEKHVRKYLEIGARHGDTFHHVMTAISKYGTEFHTPQGGKQMRERTFKKAFGVAVDYPGALWGTRASRVPLMNVMRDLKSKTISCHAIFGDSTLPSTVAMVTQYGHFDAVLIDGDHTLKGVTLDWKNYRDLAKYIIFHDIVGTGQAEKVEGNPVEVPILWERIKAMPEYETIEFVAEGSKMGIGVCWLR